MGNIFVSIGACLGFCFCNACGSVLSSCCGNDKASTVPPGATSGRKRSVILFILSFVISLVFQYAVAPEFQPDGRARVVPYLADAWTSGCDDESFTTSELQEKCYGNSGVYRGAGSAFIFFILAAITAALKPTFNREVWPAKYFLFLCLVAVTMFIPNDPLFVPIFMSIFRVGAVFFIIFQQLICIDLAYNMNENWVEKADKVSIEEGEAAGKKWLYALLATCVILYSVSIVAIALMYVYFSGCNTNLAFISVTLVMGVICTAVQLSGEEASLLTSASIFSYATFLCYSAVSKNPNGDCNPRLGDNDTLGIILGCALMFISITWTGWSNTAHKRVGEESDAIAHEKENSTEKVSGVVLKEDYDNVADREKDEDDSTGEEVATFSSSWKLNAILALITCWYAVSLTSWGSVESGGNSANPSVGKISMWMITGSQWLMLVLYLWTLLAPKLFPDRNFS